MKEKNLKGIVLSLNYIIIFLMTYIISLLNSLEMSKILKMIIWVSNYCLMTALVILVVKIKEKRKINSLGLIRNNIGKQILIGFIIFFVLILATIMPLFLGLSKHEILNFKPRNISALLFFIFYDLICVGFGEEIIFRGYFLSRIKEITKSNFGAIIISSFLFGIWHYPTYLDVTQVIGTTLIGIIFSTLRMKLKNCSTLSLSIAHGLNDAFIILLGWFLL